MTAQAGKTAADKTTTSGEAPLWTPGAELLKSSQMAVFRDFAAQRTKQSFPDYRALWQWSVDRPEDFWSALWDFTGIIGDKGKTVLSRAPAMRDQRFFPEASLNYTENLLRRRDDAPALIFRDETGAERVISYGELYALVSRWQQALRHAGVGKGDRVAGYMPNMPETIIAMLATASLGAIWSSASPDFGVQGVLDRFGQIEPKVLIAIDAYYYNGKTVDCMAKVREVAPQIKSLEKIVIVPFAGTDGAGGIDKAVDAESFIAHFDPNAVEFTRVAFDHPLFIMFSSGTTGVPKCIVHGHGGTLLQHVKELRLQSDVRPGDKVFYFTTCGWMMWNWLVTTLACEATILLYDGSPFHPSGKVLWEYASKHNCTLFGTSAKYIDALKAHNIRPADHFDLSSLRTVASTGSPLVHESFDYVYGAIKKDVHLASISGGTDIISCFVLGNPLSPVWRGEIQGPGLGMAVDVYNDDGEPIPPGGGAGELVCTKPFPCMPVMFWNDADGAKYHGAYFDRFPNIWCHGDWIERTVHNGFIIHGRSDATLNPGGVRIGTAEIYRQVEQVEDVMESIVVGQDWKGDVRIVLFVVLHPGKALTEDLKKKIKDRIRKGASPRHVPAKILQVVEIPRTKSNKITELAVRNIIHGRPVKNVEALANPLALDLYKNLPELQED